jgi:uncharacterized protein (DUF433 family)
MELTGIGLYTFGQAARLIDATPQELRGWLHGYTWSRDGERRRSQPVWTTELANNDLDGLSFHDLLEARFVKQFRKVGVSLQTIRIAAAHAREMFESQYPFTCRRFQTDGKTIFAEAIRESGDADLLDLKKKQYAFERIIRPSFYAGIEFDKERAARWFPNPRRRDVVLDPAIAFGKPIVQDVGLRTDILYQAFLAEDNDKRRVATQFEVQVKAVEAAIRFEQRSRSRDRDSQ